MGTLKHDDSPIASKVEFTASELVVSLEDGRTISVPLVWYRRLAEATSEQLHDFEILGDGEGIHWPQLDEDLSVAGLLRGARQ